MVFEGAVVLGEFANRVFDVVRRIPRGRVSTYGQVARLVGAPRSARYVGYALRANPEPGIDPGSIPCHRVVFKDGRMATGSAFGGEGVQHAMLEEEGVAFDEKGCVLMEEYLWDGVSETPPRSKGVELSSEEDVPLGPPPDFDWERELA